MHRLAVLAVPLLAVGLLPAAANAGAPAPHLVSLDQARAALPASSAMPGHPQTVVTSSLSAFGASTPCLGPRAKPLLLKQSHEVTNIYLPDFSTSDVEPTTFSITAIVFHTQAAAKVGMKSVLHLEAHCPKQQGDSEATITRTVSARYAANGWTGWRSVARISVAPDPTEPGDTGLAERLNTEYLLRGNMILLLSESGAVTPGSGPKQEKARKLATKVMLSGFAKL